MKYKSITSLIISLLFSFGISAQENTTVSGGEANGSGGSSSYSVGQVAYSANSSIDGSVIQGVQQPYEISVVDGIEEANGISLEILIYPNPTNDYLNLLVEDYNNENLSFRLYDLNGQLLKNDRVQGMETSISLEFLVHATYLLVVYDDKNIIKTFRIIKN